MTLFDYLVIGFGLLFTGTAMRLIGGLGPALHPERRYWVHALLTFLTLLAVAVSFWNFWGLRKQHETSTHREKTHISGTDGSYEEVD